MAEPRRVGQGPRRGADDRGRRAQSGALTPGGTILDATSGNTGIAYAMIGAALGYRVRLCVPANVTPERLRRPARHSAPEVVLTDPMEGSDGAIREARAIHAARAAPVLSRPVQQRRQLARALRRRPAAEIWEQTGGRVTHFVAGLGTSGTFIGTTRRLRELNPRISVSSIQPDGPLHGIEGLKHMATSIVPGIYDPERLADEDAARHQRKTAHEMTRRLAARASACSSACRAARPRSSRRVSRRSIRGRSWSTIFPDGGARYLSEPFWREQRERHAHDDERRDSIERARARRSTATRRTRTRTSAAARSSARQPAGWSSRRRPGARERHGRRPRRRFRVSADDYRLSESHAKRAGAELVGFYHSHPDHPAEPSQYDLDHAWPNFSYVIVVGPRGAHQAICARGG